MEAYLVDWASLLVRWLHIIAGIAWIGASFYFVWLDNHLEPAKPPKKGVMGEIWSVHGGGFYNKQKYLVAPDTLPEKLHWFKWEAYWTFISGLTLLVLTYWLRADSMLVDRSVADISGGTAVAISIATLVGAFVVYEALCRSPLGNNDAALGVVGFVLIVLLAWGLSHVFSGRGVYIQIGATVGTIMVASVAMVIIPGQRKMVDAMMRGETPDPIHGKRGKQRSMHNNYLTLPVVFTMFSGHYPMTYGHRHAWAILAGIFIAGALIRHFFNLRHKGRTVIALPLAGTAVLAVIAFLIAPRGLVDAGRGDAVAFGAVEPILQARCMSCHAAQPTQPGFAQPPGGIVLDRPDKVVALAPKIQQQVVLAKVMPPGNLTGMTDDERAVIARWIAQGAKAP